MYESSKLYVSNTVKFQDSKKHKLKKNKKEKKRKKNKESASSSSSSCDDSSEEVWVEKTGKSSLDFIFSLETWA